MSAECRKWHFGVLSFSGTGHLNPFIALSRELVNRGHVVTFLERPKVENRIRQAGLDFIPIGENCEASYQTTRSPDKNPTVWSEISTLRFRLDRIIHDLEIVLRDAPSALTQAGVDALLIDEIALGGPTVAQMLRLPYFIISTSVPHIFGWSAFPWMWGYRYSASWLTGAQRALLEISALRMRGPVRSALDVLRRRAGLGPIREIRKAFPESAHITQIPHFLDTPRSPLPMHFYYTGPFLNVHARPFVDFPWNRLDGRPIIYASLGTTRTVQPAIFRLIAAACYDVDLQLVISLGGRFDPGVLSDLPGQPLVVKYAPQLELLKIAKIVITHGGSNTVFETLMEGKPMIAIPLAHDQPAVAARLARLNVAEVLPVMRLSAKRIRRAVIKVLTDEHYRNEARRMQLRIRSIRGSERAAIVIDEALERHTRRLQCQPVQQYGADSPW